MSNEECTETLLRITGPATEDHSVPADVLSRLINGMQQSVLLVAAMQQKLEIKNRFKVPSDVAAKNTLRIGVSRPGSLVLPVFLANELPQGAVDLGEPSSLELLVNIFDAFSAFDRPRLSRLVPDRSYFRRIKKALGEMLPKKGERWGFEVSRGDIRTSFSERDRVALSEWDSVDIHHKEMTVSGELLRIDFAKKNLVIKYPPTGRELGCTYTEEVEEDILRERRVQLVGQFTLDENGHPSDLYDVHSVTPVDLSSVYVSEIRESWGTDRVMYINHPVLIEPSLDNETEQYFVANVDEFGLTLAGQTRDDLFADFEAQMFFLWDEYAQEDDDRLTADAIILKNVLRDRLIVEVSP